MAGLTLFLAQRTALEAGDPVGIDPAHDELAFFPLIYWPIVPGADEAAAGRHQPDRRLHETGRHRAVRYPRRHRGAAGRKRRVADAGHAGVAQHPRLARRTRTRAGAARTRADQDVLSAARLPRPLQHRPDLGRGVAARRRRRGCVAARPRRRRRLADHHHLERSCRRLGDPPRRPADAAADAGRAAATRIRLPRPASTS